MTKFALKVCTATLVSMFALHAQAADKKEAAEPAVKKSDAGICHDKTSASYAATKNFAPFASMDECIKSGGRAPAGQVATDPVKKSESGICHDKNSPSYAQTKKFTEFKTVDECVKSGGTLPKK
jgi:hypothetical protein